MSTSSVATQGKSKEWAYKTVLQWFTEATQNGERTPNHTAFATPKPFLSLSSSWLRLTSVGDDDARYQLALMHVDGVGVHMDYAAAIKLLVGQVRALVVLSKCLTGMFTRARCREGLERGKVCGVRC